MLFDYKEGPHRGPSSGGGTLPGLIQLSIEGTAWREVSDPALTQLLHLLAHEAAHVWNGEIAHYSGEVDAWMHEGSADALADRALLGLGAIDGGQFLLRQTDALNACLADLAIASIRESVSAGRPRMAYTCGNMIALLTEATLRSDARDLFDFWRAMIARARTRGGQYDVDDYRQVWRALGADSRDVTALESILDGGIDPESLADLLRNRGVVVVAAEPSRTYRRAYARDALARLMEGDCGGRIGFSSDENGFLLDPSLPCATLVSRARVLAIGGHEVGQEGHLAYDAAAAACRAKAVVTVTLELPSADNPTNLEIRCETRYPARPAPVRITDYPPLQAAAPGLP